MSSNDPITQESIQLDQIWKTSVFYRKALIPRTVLISQVKHQIGLYVTNFFLPNS